MDNRITDTDIMNPMLKLQFWGNRIIAQTVKTQKCITV